MPVPPDFIDRYVSVLHQVMSLMSDFPQMAQQIGRNIDEWTPFMMPISVEKDMLRAIEHPIPVACVKAFREEAKRIRAERNAEVRAFYDLLQVSAGDVFTEARETLPRAGALRRLALVPTPDPENHFEVKCTLEAQLKELTERAYDILLDAPRGPAVLVVAPAQ